MDESFEQSILEQAQLICIDVMENHQNLSIIDDLFLNIFPNFQRQNQGPTNRVGTSSSSKTDCANFCSSENNKTRPSISLNNSATKRKQDNETEIVKCRICFESLLDRNRIAISTECGHMFCKNCLDQALNAKKECPMCKHVIYRGFRLYF